MFTLLPLALRRLPGDADALARADGRDPRVERMNSLALLVLAAGCLLAVLFVLLTG